MAYVTLNFCDVIDGREVYVPEPDSPPELAGRFLKLDHEYRLFDGKYVNAVFLETGELVYIPWHMHCFYA